MGHIRLNLLLDKLVMIDVHLVHHIRDIISYVTLHLTQLVLDILALTLELIENKLAVHLCLLACLPDLAFELVHLVAEILSHHLDVNLQGFLRFGDEAFDGIGLYLLRST